MKINKLPKASKPIDVGYLSQLGIQSYDRDNLYPNNILKIVASSKTGSACLERYRDFMEGDGIISDTLARLIVNRQGESLSDIHALCSDDLATFDGFALHINYNEQGRVVEIHNIPFENVRLCEPDSNGVVGKIALHPDWAGNASRNGRKVRVSQDTIDYIDVFNPDPEIIAAQIEQAGGITEYKGQVLYVSSAGYLRYPLAPYDAVLTDMSTDEGISNLMLRNARNNFLPSGFFVHFKGQGTTFGDGYGDDIAETEVESDGYSEDLAHLQGDTNSLAIMDITVESKDEVPQFVPFDSKNLDKDFTNTDAGVKEAIYSKFGQEAFLAVRLGKTGFGASIMQEANDDYARKCVKKQRMLTKAYWTVLGLWAERLPDLPTMDALTVQPLTYAIKTIEEAQIDTAKLLQVLDDTAIDAPTKRAVLRIAFRLTDEQINDLVQ